MDGERKYERVFLDWFIDREVPGSIVIGPDDKYSKPDFIIEGPSGRVGVEVTNVFREVRPRKRGGSPSKEGESIRQKWLRDLAEAYYARHDIPLMVYADLRVDNPRVLTDGVMKVLSQSDHLHADEEREEAIRDADEVLRCVVRIQRLPHVLQGYRQWLCVSDQLCFVTPLTALHLQRAVDDKKARLREYRTRCERVWLLLVLDRVSNSGRLAVPVLLPEVNTTGFEAVWLVEYPRAIHRLPSHQGLEGDRIG